MEKIQLVYSKNWFQELLYYKIDEDRNLLKFFTDIENYLKEAYHFYKQDIGDTTTVGVVKTLHNYYVIKRYNIRNFCHGIKLQFRKSHGFRSFHFAKYLATLKISTIKPVAVIQKKFLFLKKTAYFISVYEEGLPGCVYFRDDSSHKENWNKAINVIYDVITKMKQNCIYHGDFHFGNFVIVNDQPKLLDFDRIKKITNKKKFTELHNKDLKNFHRYLKRNSFAYNYFKQHLKFEEIFGKLD